MTDQATRLLRVWRGDKTGGGLDLPHRRPRALAVARPLLRINTYLVRWARRAGLALLVAAGVGDARGQRIWPAACSMVGQFGFGDADVDGYAPQQDQQLLSLGCALSRAT